MKDFQKSIGKAIAFTVYNNQATFVQHQSSGEQRITLPITSLLQTLSEYVQSDIDKADHYEAALILTTPYLNRAIQHGASVLTHIPSAETKKYLNVMTKHPLGDLVNFTVVPCEDLVYSDIIISVRGV